MNPPLMASIPALTDMLRGMKAARMALEKRTYYILMLLKLIFSKGSSSGYSMMGFYF